MTNQEVGVRIVVPTGDLDGLAREWLYKLLPYRYFDKLLNDTDFCPDSILRFLPDKCKVIGVEEFGLYLYMMCNNKLSRFQLAVGDSQCVISLKNMVREMVKEVREVRERDLIDKRTHVNIAFTGAGVVLGMFHNELVRLGVLRGANTYLESVWIHTHYGWRTRIQPHLFPPYEFIVDVAVERDGQLRDAAFVSYALEECGIKRRVRIWIDGEELGLREDEVLAVLNNEVVISVVDELLREVSGLLISGFKPLISTSHLASRAFERSV